MGIEVLAHSHYCYFSLLRTVASLVLSTYMVGALCWRRSPLGRCRVRVGWRKRQRRLSGSSWRCWGSVRAGPGSLAGLHRHCWRQLKTKTRTMPCSNHVIAYTVDTINVMKNKPATACPFYLYCIFSHSLLYVKSGRMDTSQVKCEEMSFLRYAINKKLFRLKKKLQSLKCRNPIGGEIF